MAFTKLFAEILDSTIWRETNETRLVWITMLAMADKHGDVMASVPGLADRSRVTLKECEEALKSLLSPDPYSRTTDYEGRRIEVVDGGWHLLNHAKYRRKMNEEERREYNRVKQAERRKRLKEEEERRQTLSNNVNDSQQSSAMSAHTEAEAEADKGIEEPNGSSQAHSAPSPQSWETIWDGMPTVARRRSSKKQTKGAWGAIPAKHRPSPDLIQTALEGWNKYWAAEEYEFAPAVHRWIHNRQWENIPNEKRTPRRGTSTAGSRNDGTFNNPDDYANI